MLITRSLTDSLGSGVQKFSLVDTVTLLNLLFFRRRVVYISTQHPGSVSIRYEAKISEGKTKNPAAVTSATRPGRRNLAREYGSRYRSICRVSESSTCPRTSSYTDRTPFQINRRKSVDVGQRTIISVKFSLAKLSQLTCLVDIASTKLCRANAKSYIEKLFSQCQIARS